MSPPRPPPLIFVTLYLDFWGNFNNMPMDMQVIEATESKSEARDDNLFQSRNNYWTTPAT